MSKPLFTEKELILLQIILINYDPEYILLRFPLATDDLKHMVKDLLKKVSDMFINPQEEGIHPLAANREVFEKYHESIKGAIELVDGVKVALDAETNVIFDLLTVIGELCGKELIYPPYKAKPV